MKRAAALVVLAVLCACGREEAPRPAARASRLGAALKSLGSSAACRSQIPSGWSASLPVPDEDGRGWKAFFFLGEAGPDRKIVVSGPAGEARFGLDGRVTSCRRLPAPRKGLGPSLNPALSGLAIKEIDRRQEELLTRLEEVAPVYARKGRLGSEAAALAAKFKELEEPPLAEEYRKLNPDFWSWLAAAR